MGTSEKSAWEDEVVEKLEPVVRGISVEISSVLKAPSEEELRKAIDTGERVEVVVVWPLLLRTVAVTEDGDAKVSGIAKIVHLQLTCTSLTVGKAGRYSFVGMRRAAVSKHSYADIYYEFSIHSGFPPYTYKEVDRRNEGYS